MRQGEPLVRAVPSGTTREWLGVFHPEGGELQGTCLRCGAVVGIYWVHDSVWAETGLPPNAGWLCVGCLEALVGRSLTAADFS